MHKWSRCNLKHPTIFRSLLGIAIQLSARDVCPNYALIGNLYLSIIIISANRKQAYEKIEEFEQLLMSVTKQHPECPSQAPAHLTLSTPFCTDDIDGICSTSYNYGISLMDLEMIEMAEKFICKALNLLSFASYSMTGWKSNMQDAYSSILRAKCESRRLTSKRDSIMFGVDSEQTVRPFIETPQSVPSLLVGADKDVSLSIHMFM